MEHLLAQVADKEKKQITALNDQSSDRNYYENQSNYQVYTYPPNHVQPYYPQNMNNMFESLFGGNGSTMSSFVNALTRNSQSQNNFDFYTQGNTYVDTYNIPIGIDRRSENSYPEHARGYERHDYNREYPEHVRVYDRYDYDQAKRFVY